MFFDDTGTPIDHMFSRLVGEPLSIAATDLQGYGHTWQGHSMYLRFVPSRSLIEILPKKGYTEISHKDFVMVTGGFFQIEPRFRHRFSPPWHPSSIKRPRLFSNEGANDRTSCAADASQGDPGTNYFLIDEDTGVVYYHGVGSY
jgi:hypothetical protein